MWLGKTIFKVAITKTNQVKEKSLRKKKTSRRSVFQDPSFIRSLCKVVGAIGFHALHFLIMYQNHPRVILFYFYFLNWMISCFQLKPCVKCFPNLFKRFLNWKSWLLSQKTAQLVEPDEEPINPLAQPVEGCKKPYLSSRTVFQSVNVWTVTDRGPMVTCPTLNVNS